jgi:hypothetical protein
MGTEADELAREPISTWARWIMGVASAAMTVGGAVAVFMPSTNVAGVPILIVVGAGFLYVALTGQPLVNLNKDGVAFAQVQTYKRAVKAVLDAPEFKEEERKQIEDILEDNGVTIQAMSEQELEHEVRERLAAVGDDNGFEVSSSLAARDNAVDIVLSNRSGVKVGVEVKTNPRLSGWSAAVRQLRQVDAAHRILVLDRGIPDAVARSMEVEGISIVAFGPTFELDVIGVLRRVGFIK